MGFISEMIGCGADIFAGNTEQLDADIRNSAMQDAVRTSTEEMTREMQHQAELNRMGNDPNPIGAWR